MNKRYGLLHYYLSSGIQHTLAVMDSFNLDRKPTTDLDVAKKFGWEDEYYNTSGARPSRWHAIKPIVWLFLDDIWSSTSAMVLNFRL
jgi:potassium voltage-gated channel Shaw-related subfamily C protein